MAQFRLSASIMARNGARRVVAAAAYRAGEKLEDRHYGEIHDYSRRRGVIHAEIVLPAHAPAWASNRAALWSAVEDHEIRSNAQLAREVQLSLPCEFTDAQRIALTQAFAQHVAGEYGLAVDMAIHAPAPRGDNRNHHAHLMLTTRAFDPDRESGWSKTKDRRFDDIAMKRAGQPNAVESLRSVWEAMQNRALENADIRDALGNPVRVDRRSYEEQGIQQEPTIKEGIAATGLKRRGQESDRAAANDDIRERNAAAQERAGIAADVARAAFDMAALFATMPAPQMLKLQPQERELEALHAEVKDLLNPAERQRADRINEKLFPRIADRPEPPAVRSAFKPFPGQTKEHFEREMAKRAQQQARPDHDRDDIGPVTKPGFKGPRR